MNREKKKELKQAYQQGHPPIGVFQIRNLANEKVFVGASTNLPGLLNRHRFELQMGSHKNAALQADWNQFGADGFAFEILDELKPKDDPQADYHEDLAFMEEFWLERLQPYGERGYNEPKLGREARLHRIARNRLEHDEAMASNDSSENP
jgi:GIY-YIG catalytic domain